MKRVGFMKNKLSKESKRFYERELRQYWKNKEKLCNLLVKQQNSPKNNFMSSRTIIYLQDRIDYIENTIKQLNDFEKEVFLMIFKENCTWLYCETNKNINKNTYYNIFNKIIYLLAQEFGEI